MTHQTFALLMHRRTRNGRRAPRRGAVLIYAAIMMSALIAICTLAVDYGHVQYVKSEMQRCADATARGYLTYYMTHNKAYANTHGPTLYASADNPVDGNSGVTPTVGVTWGSWNSATKTFTAGGSSPVAVQVTVSRTAANGNAVPLVWGPIIRCNSIDVHATSTAVLMGGTSGNLNFSATASMYLAGSSSTYTTAYGDNIFNATPYQVTSIPVTPGSYISFSSLSGSTSVVPGYVPYSGPNGDAAIPVHHGENWDYAFDNAGPENGIADAVMPEDAVCGLFLGPTIDTSNVPATVDWTSGSTGNQAMYSNLKLQQPFMIGDGKTSGGTVQQFQVPAGATQLFVGIWDGVQYSNNGGSMTGTITQQNYIQLVQ